jgi:phenylacetate-CoA ligase
MGELDLTPCSCGRTLPKIKRLEGRRTDFLVTTSGRILHALAIIYVLREIPSVKEFQVVQEELDRVLIRLVPEPSFSDGDQKALIQRAELALGPGMRITVERTAEIPRLPSGKFRYVVSQVADAFLEDMANVKK